MAKIKVAWCIPEFFRQKYTAFRSFDLLTNLGRTSAFRAAQKLSVSDFGFTSYATCVHVDMYRRISGACVAMLESRLEMGKNPKLWVRVRFEFFIDGIGKMFQWWSSLAD